MILMSGPGIAAGPTPAPPLQPMQAWAPNSSLGPGTENSFLNTTARPVGSSCGKGSSRNDMDHILSSPRSLPKIGQLPDGLGGCMREYMEERNYLEGRLRAWEEDILALCQQHQDLSQGVAALEAELDCYRQLDEPTTELLVLLSPFMGGSTAHRCD